MTNASVVLSSHELYTSTNHQLLERLDAVMPMAKYRPGLSLKRWGHLLQLGGDVSRKRFVRQLGSKSLPGDPWSMGTYLNIRHCFCDEDMPLSATYRCDLAA